MGINIAERLKPFSHRPGTLCLIPGTSYLVEAFPALVRIRDSSRVILKEIALDVQGPLEQFTLMQDLERGCVTLFSEKYRLHILPNLDVVFQKNPHLPPLRCQERLSLGSHKKQDWEHILRRGDFCEIFPLWFRLGSLMTLAPRSGDNRGVFSLLKECEEAIASNHPEKILPAFKRLFLVAFGEMLVPRSTDEDFQGILSLHETPSDDDPLHILLEGARLIRSLFLSASANALSILPHLPPEFFAGRMLHLLWPSYGRVDLEWSKKTIRRVHLHAEVDGVIALHFRPDMRRFRLRFNQSEKGKIFSCGDLLEIKSGSHYLLDQFQK